MLALSVWALGCGSTPLRTSEPKDPEKRTAVVDPASAVPRSTDVAASSDAITTLRSPVATEAIMAFTRRLFSAFHAKAATPFEDDLGDKILDLGDEVRTIPRWQWISEFNNQVKALPYDQLDVDAMYHPHDVELYARDDLGLAGRPARPKGMEADDVLVRIPVATTRVGADILFGSEIKLLLRRVGGRYELRGYGHVLPR